MAQEVEFRSLYERTHLQVLSYCLRRTPDRDSAMDAAAETYVVAWRRFADLPDGSDGDRAVWLFAVARRVLANQRRAEGRRSRAYERNELLSEREPATSPETATIHEEERQRVLDALAQLSDDDQELLRLHEWEGLTGSELATYFDCSEGAVHVRLHRARKRLARQFDLRVRRQPPRRQTSGGDAS